MPDLRNLYYIIITADQGSFAKAAQTIGIKQSTLSKYVFDLEQRLGIQLFKRSTRGAIPTGDGQRIIALGRKILGDVQQIKDDARALRTGSAGQLTAGFHMSLSSGNLRTLLLDYSGQHPDLRVEVFERDRAELVRRLTMGLLDICFLAGDVPIEGAIMMRVWSERIMVLVPEASRLAEQSRVHWSDLRNQTFLLPERDPGTELHDMIVGHLAEPGFRPAIIQRDLSLENVLNIASAARAVTITGQSASGTQYPNAVFRELYHGNAPSQIGFSAYWRADNANPALAAFLRHLRSRYS